jgi:Ca2+-binding RTX toxin-like protein
VGANGSGGSVTVRKLTTGDGNVTFTTQNDILAYDTNSAHTLVQGNLVTLTASFGGIGSAATPLLIQTGSSDPKTMGLLATANGSIYFRQPNGNLLLNKIISQTGDVAITVDNGSALDNNNLQHSDTRTAAQLLTLWNTMNLTGAGADISAAATVAAFQNSKKAEYQAYWQDRNVTAVTDADGNITGYTADAYNPNYTATLSTQEQDYYTKPVDQGGLGWTSDQVNDLLAKRTAEYFYLHSEYSVYGETYDPNWTYTVSDSQRQQLTAGYSWTLDELQTTVGTGILETSQTNVTVEDPNVVGNKVTIIATNGGIGSNDPNVVINLSQTVATFDPSTALSGKTIDFGYAHGLVTGQAVVYHNGGGTSLTDLTDGATYYVIEVANSDPTLPSEQICLASSQANALAGIAMDLGTAPAGTHSLVATLHTNTFNPLPAGVVAGNTISFGYAHNFNTGEEVIYSSGGGQAIGGLINGNAYYVVKVSGTSIELALSEADAEGGSPTVIALDASVATGTSHTLRSALHLNDDQKLLLAQAEPTDLTVDSVHNLLTVSQRNDVNVDSAGSPDVVTITASAKNNVYLGTQGEFKVDRVVSTSGDLVKLSAPQGIVNASTNPSLANVTGGNLILESADQGVGGSTAAITIDLSASATLTVRSFKDVYITEQSGNSNAVNVDSIITDATNNGKVTLVANGSILNSASLSGQVNIAAAGATLTSIAGSVGIPGALGNLSSGTPILTHLRGSGENLDVTALLGAFVKETVGDLNVGQVTSTGGDVKLEAVGSISNALGATGVNVKGDNITLWAHAGNIGIASQELRIDTADGGILSAYAFNSVYLVEVSNNLRIDQIQAVNGQAFIDAQKQVLSAGLSSTNVIGLTALILAGEGAGTSGSPLTLQVGTLAGDSGSGDMWLDNTGALIIGSVGGTDGLTAGGSLHVTTHSPLKVQQSSSSVGDMYFTSVDSAANDDYVWITDNVTLTSGGTLYVQAGDNVTIDSGTTLVGTTGIVVQGDTGGLDAGIGSTIDISGDLTAPTLSITGGIFDDTINLNNLGIVHVAAITVDGGGANNTLMVDDSRQTNGDSATLSVDTLTGLNGPTGTIGYLHIKDLTIDLGQGNDNLVVLSAGSNASDTTTINAGPGSDKITMNVAPVHSFILDGGTGNNTLQGPSAALAGSAYVWNITSQNAGDLGLVDWNSFQNLTGGSRNDTFVLSDNTGVDGRIYGGSGFDTMDYRLWSAAHPVTVDLGHGLASGCSSFNSVEHFIGGQGVNTLVGTLGDNQWNITGANSGNIGGAGVLDWEQFQQLVGGPAKDSFVFSDGAYVSGTVNGGDGYNTMDYHLWTAAHPVTVDLGRGLAPGCNSYSNMQHFIGGQGFNTLIGMLGENHWNITGANAGNIDGAGVLDWEQFQQLVGGPVKDFFVFSDGAYVDGKIDAMGGYDTMDYHLWTAAHLVTVNLGYGLASGCGSFSSVEHFIGGQGLNTLTGTLGENHWNITGVNAGNIGGAGVFDWEQFQQLVGGPVKDFFVFSDAASVDDKIDGSDGFDTMDYHLWTSAHPVTVDLGHGLASGCGSFSGVEHFIGGQGLNTLIGTLGDNQWNITDVNVGNIGGAGVLDWEQFQHLLGGPADDRFVFSDGKSVTSTIDGQGGVNTLDYSAADNAVRANLTQEFATGVDGERDGGIANIQNVTGGAGNDWLVGDSADNVLIGNGGDDWLQGMGGGDTFVGGTGSNRMEGGKGNDMYVLTPSGGDTITDTGGTNALDFSNATSGVKVDLHHRTGDSQTLDAAGDTLRIKGTITNLTGSAFADTLTGNELANTIHGGAGNDVINGGGGADMLYGDAGNDELHGGGNTTLIGGAGNDTLIARSIGDKVSYVDSPAAVNVDLSAGTASDGYGGTDTLKNVHSVVGSSNDDTLTGSKQADVIQGGPGSDTIDAGAGDDQIIWNDGDGNDTVDGGAGKNTLTANGSSVADAITVDAVGAQARVRRTDHDQFSELVSNVQTIAVNSGDGDDTVTVESLTGTDVKSVKVDLGSGDDVLSGENSTAPITAMGGSGNDTFRGGSGNDVFNGGTGENTVDYSQALAGVKVNLASSSASNDGDGGHDTLRQIQDVTGSDFADTIRGDSKVNVIDGGAGDDIIHGSSNSVLRGGDGNDKLYADSGSPTLYGGAGDDDLHGGSGSSVLHGDAGNDTLYAGSGNNVLIGGEGDDTLRGGSGASVLDGGTGNDSLYAGSGKNQLWGGAGDDVLHDSKGSSRLYGENGNDTLHAGLRNAGEYLDAGAGANTVYSENTADTVVTGLGDNTVYHNNDTSAAARDLGTIQQGSSVDGQYLFRSGDVDWFKFTLATAGGAGNEIETLFTRSAGDIKTMLYASPADAQAQISKGTVGVDCETISLDGLAAGTYYLKVMAQGANSYSLKVDRSQLEGNRQVAEAAPNTTAPQASDPSDFGQVMAGTTRTHTFTVGNAGSPAAGNPRVTLSGPDAGDFAVVAQSSLDASAPGGMTTFQIAFMPGAMGLRTATVNVAGNDGDNPLEFTIQATAIPAAPLMQVQGNGVKIDSGEFLPIAVDGSDFGTISLTGGAVTRIFTIRNTGQAVLHLTDAGTHVSITGANASDFSVISVPSEATVAGGTTTFQIRFAPGGLGMRIATVSIASDDGTCDPYTFTIQGTGETD